MLLPQRIEVKGRNTPLGIQQQAEEELSSIPDCESTSCASRADSAGSLPPTPSSLFINTFCRENSDEKERKTHQHAAQPGRLVQLVQTRDLWQS
jgi:hypothetical protein